MRRPPMRNAARPDYPLKHEAFGQLRFGFTDPGGLWVDIVEQVEPAEGFWDRYMGG